MMSKKPEILYPVLGGILLFLGTLFLSAFFSTPPSRAEFDTLKTDMSRQLQNIDSKLENIRDNQNRLLNHLLRGKK